MLAVKEGKHLFLSAFEERLAEDVASGRSRSQLGWQLRRRALERLAAMELPTLKDEDWRFTSLAPLLKVPFQTGQPEVDGLSDRTQFVPLLDGAGTHLVCEDCRQPVFSHQGPSLPAGVVVCSLAEALARHPGLVEPHLARHADFASQVFTALNTAFLQDGAFVYIPAGLVVEGPIYLTFVTTAHKTPLAWHRRCLIVAEPGSQVRIVESYTGADDVYFTNAVTEVAVAANALVDHYRIQSESKQSFHVGTVHVRQERGSNYTSCAVGHGGALARTNLNVVLDEEGAACTLNGLYLAAGDQLIDNHTQIDHARPHCTSHELYKGILSGRARGVFHGKIHVHQDAQKTDARQANQTLLLSDDAVIDSTPQLEIYADDVKCTHGASIGRLDEEQVFYLRTRGLGQEEARQLLTYAFANDIIRRIGIEPLRDHLEQTLFAVTGRQTVKEAP